MRIDSVAALERVIGKTPPPVHLKVIDHLDESALRWIAVSPLAFVSAGGAGSVAVTLAGGAPGFASAEPGRLRIPLALIDEPAILEAGAAFGSLFLAPPLGETLRVNGRVAAVEDGAAVISVEECYGHCAKALIRSEFWVAAPVVDAPAEPADFIAQSRFMALATLDAQDRADLSPKGDPAGGLARLHGEGMWFADRPGNRRADSFRNILAQPQAAALLLVPGSARVAAVRGAVRLTTEPSALADFAVHDKTPKLAALVEQPVVEMRDSPALARAGLWPARALAEGIDPAAMFAAHVKLNRDKGLTAKLASAVVSVPGLMRKSLEQDYKSNLY